MSTLAEVLTECLERHGERPAVSDPKLALSYGELRQRAQDAARFLSGPLVGRHRPRVGLAARNSASYVAAYCAILAAGGVPFLIDAAADEAELRRIAADCTLDGLVHDRSAPAHDLPGAPGLGFDRLAAGSADGYPMRADTAVCRFTSGSTGKPHCIEFTAEAVRAAARNWAVGTGLTGADRITCFAGLSNGLAFNTSLLAAFLVGAQLRLPIGLPAAGQVVRALRRSGTTRLVGFPVLYDSVSRRTGAGGALDGAFDGITQAVSSGAPLKPATADRFRALTGVAISNYYGVAEAGPLTFAPDPRPQAGLGAALPGVVLRAGTEGEPARIRVRSESMASGYLNAPGVFATRIGPDGLYDTGDEGWIRDGLLHLTGRSTRMVNVGGRKIDPAEVVRVLLAIPGVEDAVVLEAPDRHGEPALAAVIAIPGLAVAGRDTAVLDAAAVRAHALRALPSHKVPTQLRLVDRLSAGAIGKPSLGELRTLFADPAPPRAPDLPSPPPIAPTVPDPRTQEGAP
jgi:acyl-CoA synthetase (AMP-forming)/AMP-acid ligase II